MYPFGYNFFNGYKFYMTDNNYYDNYNEENNNIIYSDDDYDLNDKSEDEI